MVGINKKSYKQSTANVKDKYYELFPGQGGKGLAKALNPLYPLSTLLSHTGTKAIACKIRRRFISVETEVLLANLITLSQTKHKLCPSRADALAWPPF